ncbi:hypothetical protein BGZ99_003530, partial [Dissophora globulifera]
MTPPVISSPLAKRLIRQPRGSARQGSQAASKPVPPVAPKVKKASVVFGELTNKILSGSVEGASWQVAAHPEWPDEHPRLPFSAQEFDHCSTRDDAMETLENAKDTQLNFQYAVLQHHARLVEAELLAVKQQITIDKFDAPAGRKQAWEEVIAAGLKEEQEWHLQCMAKGQHAADSWQAIAEGLEVTECKLTEKHWLHESDYTSDYEQDHRGR